MQARAQFPPEPRSASQARHWVRDHLNRLGRTDLVPSAETGVSELVTNGILHAHTSIGLALSCHRDRVVIEVYDGSPMSQQPTALVHEAFERLAGADPVAWNDRVHFVATAAQLMRRILVDHARGRAAAKRGRGMRVTLAEDLAAVSAAEPDLLDLDAALDELAALDARQATLVELRFFGGLDIEEAARALEVSVATANRDWVAARAWLFRRLKQMSSPPPPA